MHSKTTVSALGQHIKDLKIDKRLDMNGKEAIFFFLLMQGIYFLNPISIRCNNILPPLYRFASTQISPILATTMSASTQSKAHASNRTRPAEKKHNCPSQQRCALSIVTFGTKNHSITHSTSISSLFFFISKNKRQQHLTMSPLFSFSLNGTQD